MADGCVCCDEPYDKDNVMQCTECTYFYHLGTCSGVSESTFKSKGATWHNAWRCPTCRTAKLRSSQSKPEPKQRSDEIDVTTILVGINEKLESLMGLKESVTALEQSVSMMSAKYDEVLKHMRQHDGDIKSLKNRVTSIENRERETNVQQIAQDMNALEWQTRKMNLEVHGIPVSEHEDLLGKLNLVAEKLEVPVLAETDIAALHRLPARPDKVPCIIVRFARQATRDQWLDKRRKLNRTDEDCYILENMTRQDRALLSAAKEWAKENGYRYSWHRNGKIFLRRRDGERVILVKCEMDLQNLR